MELVGIGVGALVGIGVGVLVGTGLRRVAGTTLGVGEGEGLTIFGVGLGVFLF